MAYTVSDLRAVLADFGEGVHVHVDGKPVAHVQAEFRKDTANICNLLLQPPTAMRAANAADADIPLPLEPAAPTTPAEPAEPADLPAEDDLLPPDPPSEPAADDDEALRGAIDY